MNHRQHYRKNVSLVANIAINDSGYAAHVQNLSISGALIYIDSSSKLYDERDMFNLVQYLAVIGIFIEKLDLTTQAEIMHITYDAEHLMIGVKFKQELQHSDPLMIF